MRAVNLLPPDTGSRRTLPKVDPVVLGGTAAALLVCCAIGAGFMSAHSRAASEASKLETAKAVLLGVTPKPTPATKTPTTPIIPVPAVTAEQQPRLAAVSTVLSARTSWDRVLREFAQVVPSDVTVSGLSMAGPNSVAATPGTFSLTGSTTSHDGVARLLSRLMLLPDLADVSLTNSTADPTAGTVAFTIDAQVKGAGA